jgi:hypothetical protein
LDDTEKTIPDIFMAFLYSLSMRLLTSLFVFVFYLIYRPMNIYSGENISSKIRRHVLPDEVNISLIKGTILYLQHLGNRTTWEKQWESARWLEKRLREYGLEVEIHTYEYNSQKWPNVFAKIVGKNHHEQLVMPIAHLDSISDDPEGLSPGADDNAGGVAVALEIARILKHANVDKTVMIGFFTNEERDAIGSKNFARKARAENLDIHAVINLDVLGYNEPNMPVSWNTVLAHHTLKNKVKSIWRMGNNYFHRKNHGKNVVKVVGKKANVQLLKSISKSMRDSGSIRVEEVIRDDCG